MSDQLNKEYQATPAATLEQQIMNPNFPKNEREWWAAARIEQLEAALRDMAQEDATNARRMRTAIVMARKKLDISRPVWTGPILQADGILEQALTVNNDRAALGEEHT